MCTALGSLPQRDSHQTHTSEGSRGEGSPAGWSLRSTRDGEGDSESRHQSPSFGVGGTAEGVRQHLGCCNQSQGPAVSRRSRRAWQLPKIWSIQMGGRQPGFNKLEEAA